jgi:hypothetical protein
MKKLNLLFSIIPLIYIFYKSEIVSQSTKHDDYLIYYIISFTYIIVSLAIFCTNKKIQLIFFLTIYSAIFSFYSFEIYLYLKFNKKKINQKADLINDYKNKIQKENYVLSYNSAELIKDNLKILTLSGISNKKTIHCNENGYYSTYESDRYGFNNPDEVWNKNKIDFLLIGDSFVHGNCVFYQNTIAGNLANKTNENIISLGLSGNGPLKEYASLKEYSQNKKIKNILWFYYEGNDLLELSRELKNSILIKYFNNEKFTQNLINIQNIIDEKLITNMNNQLKNLDDIEKNQFSLDLKSILKLFNTRKILIESRFNQKPLNEFENIISNVKFFAKKNDINFYFIYLPEYFRFLPSLTIKKKYKNYEDILNIIKKNNINLIDINQEIITNIKNPIELYPNSKHGHFTPKGYDFITTTILEKILAHQQ